MPLAPIHRTLGDRPVSLFLVFAGAASVSWDVVGVDLADRTIKLTTVLFLVAVAVRLAQEPSITTLARAVPPRHRVTLGLVAALVGWLLLRSLFTGDLIGSLVGFAAVLIPAGAPFVATLLHRRWAADVTRAFVYGMAFAGAVALLEFVLRSAGANWITDYDATVGGTPRSAALAFEAAYFAAPSIAALLIVVTWWRRRLEQAALALLLVGGLVVANARIVFVQIAVVMVLLGAVAFRLSPNDRHRLLRTLGSCIAVGLVATLALVAVRPSIVDTVADRASSILDPEEETSNSPRLEQFERVGNVIADHPFIGIGPGMLGDEFVERGYVSAENRQHDASFVTNNVWTQALVDGGAIALALQAAMVIWVASRTRRGTTLEEASLLVAWASIVLGAGLTVSNFWDGEPWLLLGAYLGLTADDEPGTTPRPIGDAVEAGQT